MSLQVVVSLASLLFFAGFAAAGISAPACDTSWEWTANSLGQNPCTVAAYLISTCHSGSYTIDPLPAGYHYVPDSHSTDTCLCNTVAYSLLSACEGCQGGVWDTYLTYSSNCTTLLGAGNFPNPVPSGTSVPYWAFIGITSADNWSPTKAIAAGDTPEAGPGSKID